MLILLQLEIVLVYPPNFQIEKVDEKLNGELLASAIYLQLSVAVTLNLEELEYYFEQLLDEPLNLVDLLQV